MGKVLDLTNQRFDRLIAIPPTEQRDDGNMVWECRCDCGKTVYVGARRLVEKNTKSCGCLQKDVRDKQIDYFRRMAAVDSVGGTRLSHLNHTRYGHNTSGVRGVSWNKASGKWMATITFQKKTYYLGVYQKKEAVVLARQTAEEILWKPFLKEQVGEFANQEELKEQVNRFIRERIEKNRNVSHVGTKFE